MDYVFEGTVSEIETDGNDKIISFKVCGSEGYVLKKEDTKFNVFSAINNTTTAYMFESNQKIKYTSKNNNLLISALIFNKRIKLQILQGGTKNQFTIGTDFFGIESLSIIAN